MLLVCFMVFGVAFTGCGGNNKSDGDTQVINEKTAENSDDKTADNANEENTSGESTTGESTSETTQTGTENPGNDSGETIETGDKGGEDTVQETVAPTEKPSSSQAPKDTIQPTPKPTTKPATAQVTTKPAATNTPAATAAPKKEWKGTVKLSFPMGPTRDQFDAVAKAYMKMNPGVTVVLDDKDVASYGEWISAQMAGSNISADIVYANFAQQFFADNKFVDYTSYLIKSNPYGGGKKWKDMLNESAYRPAGPNKEILYISPDSTQILWFYNKDMFREVGVQPPKDWDELVEISKKLDNAGYTPLALSGRAETFWGGKTAWLLRIYHDQYWRDMEPQWAAQKGDYMYDPDLDGTWKFNINDINNDAPDKVNFNKVRIAKMVQEGKVGADTDKYREMYENLEKMIPLYCGKGFFERTEEKAGYMFVQKKAAMIIQAGGFEAGCQNYFNENPKYKFDIGYFWSPPMKGKHVGSQTTRSLGGPQGFLGVINKSKTQNDLVMDFMMYLASAEGQNVRYKAMEGTNIYPSGPSMVKGVKLPGNWNKYYEEMGYRGECDLNPAMLFSQGMYSEMNSVRAFQDLTQSFFKGTLSLLDYSKSMQKELVNAIPKWLDINGYRPDALNDPSKDPSKK